MKHRWQQLTTLVVMLLCASAVPLWLSNPAAWLLSYVLVLIVLYELWIRLCGRRGWNGVIDSFDDGIPVNAVIRLVADETLRGTVVFHRPWSQALTMMRWRVQIGSDISVEGVLTPGLRRQLAYAVDIGPMRRGCYEAITVNGSVYDVFGLQSYLFAVTTPVQVIVHPLLVPMPTGLGPLDSEIRHMKSQAGSRYPEGLPAGVRPYQAGDRLAHVHWPSTARHNQVMVRDQPMVRPPSVWIGLDVSQTESALGNRFELAVSLCGSIAQQALTTGADVHVQLGLTSDAVGPGHDVVRSMRDVLDGLAAVNLLIDPAHDLIFTPPVGAHVVWISTRPFPMEISLRRHPVDVDWICPQPDVPGLFKWVRSGEAMMGG